MDKANQILREILGIAENDPLPFDFGEVDEHGAIVARPRISASITIAVNDISEQVIRDRVRGALVEIARFAIDLRGKINDE